MTRRRLAIALTVIAASTIAAPALAEDVPVLGSSDFISSPDAVGFGAPEPSEVFNGGDPSGHLDQITWKHWGDAAATGTARANIFKPQGSYYSPVSAQVKASKLGTCDGKRAYKSLQIREPQWPGGPLGPWLSWSGTLTMCDHYDDIPLDVRPPGFCGDVGKDTKTGSVVSLEAYRISCTTAKRAVRAAAGSKCTSSKTCKFKGAGLACKLSPTVKGERTVHGTPVQRVACTRGSGNLSGFLVVG